MRFTPAITTGIQDPQVRQLLEFVLKLLGSVVQYDLYKLDGVTWHVPFVLNVSAGGAVRIMPPEIVRLGKAVAVGDEITPVHTGSVLWTWQGNNQVLIQDAAGLVDGVKYDLTFEVLGG